MKRTLLTEIDFDRQSCRVIEAEIIKCNTCKGSGWKEVSTHRGNYRRRCAQCHGTGKVLVGPKVR